MKKRHLIFAAAILGLLGIGWFIFLSPCHIRVQNETGHDFAEVKVMSDSLGAVKTGATSQYLKVNAAYGDASVLTTEPSGYFRNDRVINTSGRLLSGQYTYILRVTTNDMLDVTLHKD